MLINGFNVGKVRHIYLTDFLEGRIMVKFVVNYPNLEIPVGSQAKIISTDLMGTKAIEIVLADNNEFYSHEDTLPGLIEGDLKDQVNSQMLPFKRAAEDLMSSMDSVLVSLQMVFGPDNRTNLSESFESISQTIKNLEKTSVFIDQYVKNESGKISFILSNADSISSGLKDRSNDLEQIISNITDLSDTLGQIPFREIVTKLNLVLSDFHELFSGINRGEGNLGMLSQDDSLYIALKSAIENLDYLISDIRVNPKRYIHLSAIDRGKTVITSDDSEFIKAIRETREVEYFVCVIKSANLLPEDHEAFKTFNNLSFIQIGGTYYYYFDKTRNIDRGRRLVSRHIDDYPGAGLYAWINGKWQVLKF